MLDTITTLLHNHLVQGAINGVFAAAVVDIHAFVTWKSFQDAATYSWKTAAFRWVQGAGMGFLTAAGLLATVGT